MARETCIAHPVTQDFFIIRRGYYELTDRSKIQAALLWALEWFTSYRMRELRRANDSGEPWVEISFEEFEQEMFGFFCERSMPQAISALEAGGWVRIDRSASLGRKTRYLFLVDEAQRRLNQWAGVSPEYTSNPEGKSSLEECDVEGKSSLGPKEKVPSHVGKSSLDYIGSIEREEILEEPSISPLTDLTLEDTPEVFLQNTYARTRRGKFRKTGKHGVGLQSFIALEAQHGAADVRRAFLRYLDKDDQWLRDNHWPLPYFVKNYGQFEMFEPRPWSAPAPATEASPILDQPVTHIFHGYDLGILAQFWNERVLAQPVIWDKSIRPKYHPSIETPQFAGKADELCNKIQALCSGDPEEFGWLTFHWFIGEKDGIPNWTKVASKYFGTRRGPAKGGRSVEQGALDLLESES